MSIKSAKYGRSNQDMAPKMLEPSSRQTPYLRNVLGQAKYTLFKISGKSCIYKT